MPNQRPRVRFTSKARKANAISLAVACCFSVSVSTTALSNPTGPSVVSGSAIFNRQGNVLAIENSPRAIINWQGFSIAAGETTRFIQQSAASSVLNRVVGADPSNILGALQSNGRVFLINPNGILFGAGAQIDVAGLVASTLKFSDGDFLAGRLRFTDTPGAGNLVNHGAITTPSGGQIYLIAPNVHNTGIITSPQGEIILAAGRSVELVDAGTPNLRLQISAPDNEAVNVGQLIASSGKLGIYGGLIRNSGAIRADGVTVGSNGEILLIASQNATLEAGSIVSASGPQGGNITLQSGDTTLVSGTVAAQGSEGAGGVVQVLGNLVGLVDNAAINASGATGGGTVLVGGDYQGANPDVQNAFRTYVGPQATIRADAVTSGDGGKVVVWSDDATRFYGTIIAKGGVQRGDGGFVEVSGKRWLDFAGLVNTSAPNGLSGTLLLDPSDVTISDASDSFAGGAFTSGIFGGATGTANIQWSTIDTQLSSSNVIITTSGSGGSGDITVADGHGYSSSNDLSLLANNQIILNGFVNNTGSGDLNLFAGWDGLNTTIPAVVAGATHDIIFNARFETLGGMTLKAGDEITAIAGATSIVVSAGALQTISAGGTLTVRGGTLGGNNIVALIRSAGGQTISAANITLTGGIGNGGFAEIRQTGAGANQTITLTSSVLTLEGGSGGVDNFARIRNEGVSQLISFASPGTTTLTGGTGVSGNFARVQALTGTQTINGSPTITLTGGASGGVDDDGNVAQILANVGHQRITAGNTSIIAGNDGVDNSANIVASTQSISVSGNLSVIGGNDSSGPNPGGGGARIGGVGGATPTATNLALTVTGNATLTPGTNTAAVIGSGVAGGQPTNITIKVEGDLTMNAGTGTAGPRIGSPLSNVAGGDIFVTANNISLAPPGPNGSTTSIRTANDITLLATSGNLSLGGDVSAGGYAILRATAGAITDTNGSANNVTAQILEAAAKNGINLDIAISGGAPSLVNATNSTSGDISLRNSTATAVVVQNIHNAGGNNNLSGLTTDELSSISTGGVVIHGEWPAPSGSGGDTATSILNPQHEFTTDGSGVTIILNSPRANAGDFSLNSDPVLFLLGSNGNFIQRDDDSGQGFVARIDQPSLPAGTYRVVAATFNPGQITPFDLSISGLVTAPIPPVPPSQPVETINQAISTNIISAVERTTEFTAEKQKEDQKQNDQNEQQSPMCKG